MKLSSVFLVSFSLSVAMAAPSAKAQTCCSPDTEPCILDELVNIPDVLVVLACAFGLPPREDCPEIAERCDVDCNGVADFRDAAYVLAAFGGASDVCNISLGACCHQDTRAPACIVTSAGICGIMPEGEFLGNGTSCDPSPCDCNTNGTDDGVDISNGTSDDCNTNGIPDECEPGSCCLLTNSCEGGERDGYGCNSSDDCRNGTCTGPEVTNCFNVREADCAGMWGGPCNLCARQNALLVVEPGGGTVTHFIGPPVACGPGGSAAGVAPCDGPPYTDAWVTASGGVVCHDFGDAGTDPIPADFFGPGSDPYASAVCFNGVPLGVSEFGDADTLVLRSADPFDRCILPSATQSTVDIEIIALSLASSNPITVTFNGGQDPESWTVTVDLSPGGVQPGTPSSTLTAVKDNFNGGTYTSILHVQPRFTFTRESDAAQTVLDTLTADTPAIVLNQTTPMSWVSELDENLNITVDLCSAFHPGLDSAFLLPQVDCNGTGMTDSCDIENGVSQDVNGNGVPDECETIVDVIPTMSTMGIVVLAVFFMLAAGVIVRRNQAMIRSAD